MKKILITMVLALIFFPIFLLLNQTVKSDYECPVQLYVSHSILDFNKRVNSSNPTMNFFISNLCNGTLKAELSPSSIWIKLSESSFEGNLKEIIVLLDVSNLPPGLYKEKIEIQSNGGNYILPIRLDLVEKKVIIQFIPDNQKIVINSKPIISNWPPFVYHGIFWVPLRIICESFGTTLTFEPGGKKAVQRVDILYKDIHVQLMDGESYMLMNGIKCLIDEPFLIRGNSTFIPLNVIKTIFNPDIQYNSTQRLFTITY
jgi:hypothetical protein